LHHHHHHCYRNRNRITYHNTWHYFRHRKGR
jgi:hypothetical protein